MEVRMDESSQQDCTDQNQKPDPEFMARGPFCWGRGKTEQEALDNMMVRLDVDLHKIDPTQHISVHKGADLGCDGMGTISSSVPQEIRYLTKLEWHSYISGYVDRALTRIERVKGLPALKAGTRTQRALDDLWEWSTEFSDRVYDAESAEFNAQNA